MISIREQLPDISDFDLSQLINLEGKLNGSSFLLYLKDLNGEYLHVNQPELELFGYQKESQMVGLTDLDLCMTTKEAFKVRTTDHKIIKAEKPVSLIESATTADRSIMVGFSLKAPLRLKTNKIIGVMGVTFVLERKSNQISDTTNIKLTNRQKECLHYLTRGMTAKKISQLLNLSPKTVESHFELLKRKLNCISRQQLIEKAFELGIV